MIASKPYPPPPLPVSSISLWDVTTPDETHRNETNLLGDGYLRRGQTGLYVGATGIGKSVMLTQAAIAWSVGRSFFGLRCQLPLRILIVQAENDDADVAEMRDGIANGLALSREELRNAADHVHILRSFKSGPEWFDEIEAAVTAHKPDLMIVDPLFAYAGVDLAKDQPGLSRFLRSYLLPFTLRHNLGVILVHHTNKPAAAAKDRSSWQAGDYAYSGSGHNELANFPRFVTCLRSIGSHTVFELVFGKRSSRAELVDDTDKPTDRLLVKHAAQGIHWELASQQDIDNASDASGSDKTKAGRAREIAQKVFGAFDRVGENRAASLKKLAATLKVEPRSVRRYFGDTHRIELDGRTLELRDSIVTEPGQLPLCDFLPEYSI